MRAIVQTRYGSPDVLQLEDVDKPVVKDDEVLVRVRWHLLRGVPYVMRLVVGLRGPRREIPGLDIAGQVEAAGRTSSSFGLAMRCSAGARAHSPSMRGRGRTTSCPSRPTSR
jgi:NADPH:quinone reductase-like Zn-dependent oxidoreductase